MSPCQVRGSSGEHSEAVGGKYDISNRERMGITEFQAVQKMYEGVGELINCKEVPKRHLDDFALNYDSENHVEGRLTCLHHEKPTPDVLGPWNGSMLLFPLLGGADVNQDDGFVLQTRLDLLIVHFRYISHCGG